MARIMLDAPCKINLALEIQDRLENGYHRLETVMQTIDLCDRLTIQLEEGGPGGIFLHCDREEIPCDGTNIVWRCAQAFLARLGRDPGDFKLHMYLEKRIPVMAGLGGGSADGAAALVGLNLLLDAGLGVEELCALGAEVGSDIPFCIRGGTALVSGVGQDCRPLPPLPGCFVLVAQPQARVSTGAAYQAFDRLKNPRPVEVPRMVEAIRQGSLAAVAAALGNSFEQVLEEAELGKDTGQIGILCSLLRQSGALGALMTGSGSAVFGLFDREDAARRCAAWLEGEGSPAQSVFLTSPVQHGPISR